MPNLCFEQKRGILEELEIIEDAISARLRRNPEIFYKFNDTLRTLGESHLEVPKSDVTSNRIYKSKKSKRSRKQMKAQELEISLFLGRYRKLLKCLQQDSLNPVLVDQFKDDDLTFEKFETITSEIINNSSQESQSLEETKKKYQMFSSSIGNTKNILSSFGQIIDVQKSFDRNEYFGMYLELSGLFSSWLNIIKKADYTMTMFIHLLQSFTTYDFLFNPLIERNTKEYRLLITNVLKYYKSFFSKAYPLIDKEILSKKIQDDFTKYISIGIPVPQSSEEGKLFCVVGDKEFDNQNALNDYLNSKAYADILSKNKKNLLGEFTFHFYSQFFSKELQNTLSFVERKLAFTDEELREEMDKLQEQYESSLYGPDEKEDKPAYQEADDEKKQTKEVDPSNPFSLPLGPDGFPIPRWLYKVQGLDVKYTCEICGNQIYHGRREFEKHFQQKKHTEGLRSLGIIPSPAFKDISTISEAKTLWESMNSKNSSNKISATPGLSATAMALEEEDSEGNVMSSQVYEELKKQGLL